MMVALAGSAAAADVDEFKVKREPVFEFAQKPAVTREGDKVTIAFETKGFCDVTVAIEEFRGQDTGSRNRAATSMADQGSASRAAGAGLYPVPGRIVRHLVSGVLGPNAPEPFQRDSKKQVVVWDGKDDQGRYLDEKDRLTIRVSLGLKPLFERTLFWSPHKRLTGGKAIDGDAARVCPRPEGVYVADGTGVDVLRLFDHDGNYVRTIYPFPADKARDVTGLEMATFPQDGQTLPLKRGMVHGTFFTCGSSSEPQNKYGHAAQALAVHGDRMAVAFYALNRLATDGSSGGLLFEGPKLGHPVIIGNEDLWARGQPRTAAPRSAAFSPDGKWLYLSGFGWCGALGRAHEWLSGVTRMDFASNDPPELFLGSVKQGAHGNGAREFKWATSVATDPKGRVYVTDHLNDRLQVFTPEGQLLKSIPVRRPVRVDVHQKTGEIYVFSWRLGSDWWDLCPGVKPTMTRFGPVDDPRVLAACPLPFLKDYDYGRGGSSRATGGGFEYRAALDSWAAVPTIWLFPGKGEPALLLVEEDGKLSVKRDFTRDIARTVVRAVPPILQRQRLYVNPADGMLYVGEGDSGVMKSFKQLVQIDPATGRITLVELPFTAEDLAIDLDGHFYLRTDVAVGRYDPITWKEIPFDYGMDMPRVGFDVAVRGAPLVGGLLLPENGRPSWWHHGGMSISPSGHIAATCHNPRELVPIVGIKTGTAPISPDADPKRGYDPKGGIGRAYKPVLYPGRAVAWQVHVFDEFGRVLREDALPGIDRMDGIGIDKDDDLYILAHQNRVLDGHPYFLGTSSTLLKVKSRAAKVLSASDRIPIPLDRDSRPKRHPDVSGAWIEGTDWMYGGVGLNNMACICWNARPALDLFARSFAPEIDHFSVAILDANGNLILRAGRYGNVDEGTPLVAAGGPPAPRPIGGDETALVHPAYLATHSDRRLFIADAGNSRIVSVKLDYHATERVALRDVQEGRP